MEENKDRNSVRLTSDDVAAVMMSELQDTIDTLQAELAATKNKVTTLELAATATDNEVLRALAVTIRTAQRNGHPDAAKHLETLLKALGA